MNKLITPDERAATAQKILDQRFEDRALDPVKDHHIDKKRNPIGLSAADSGKLTPAVKSNLVARNVLAELRKIHEDTIASLDDLRRYLSIVPEADIGGDDWNAILSFLNSINGAESFLRRQAAALDQSISDAEFKASK